MTSFFLRALRRIVAGKRFRFRRPPQIIIAQAEAFRIHDEKGWKLTPQDESYASHIYGGMWTTHGVLLGAPADSDHSLATLTIQIPTPGRYRVWSKYQAPPYFHYQHQIEIAQNGQTVFSHLYGQSGAERLWSFGAQSDELWWDWGVDHDAAEAPIHTARLCAGPAEIRLSTLKSASPSAQPAGDRFIDFLVLTTNRADDYKGFQPRHSRRPYNVATPFAEEAFAATKLYLRFQNSAPQAACIHLSRLGHFHPQYQRVSVDLPPSPVAPGAWSEWFNIGPFLRLVHDEGVFVELPGAETIRLQVAHDGAGRATLGDLQVGNGEAFVIPIDATWNSQAKIKTSREHASEIVALSKTWRKSPRGRKPRQLIFCGEFRGASEEIEQLRDCLGYNAFLERDEAMQPGDIPPLSGFAAHARLLTYRLSDSATGKETLRILSFGDEIGLGTINYADPALQTKFAGWLRSQGIGEDELGVAPEKAALTQTGDGRLVWYSHLFAAAERFADYAAATKAAKAHFGDDVLTGANFSPHHLALYYGPLNQWIELFKHRGMSLFWSEDHIFSVPEVPQMISWQFAQMRCATKYHHQPIHFFVMPHAPGQTAENLRRNMIYSVGAGAKIINNFWIAPAETFSENYVSWSRHDTFRALQESIYDAGEIEDTVMSGTVRRGHVAIVLSKATDFHESRLRFDKSHDPFTARCKNAPPMIPQTLCRKEQQMLYLALRAAQQGVDLITEDDIVESDCLQHYQAVYFAGEWIDRRVISRLDEWVRNGGVLYAAAGLGHRNQFDEPENGLQKILGLKDSRLEKNLLLFRTLLELPQAPPIGAIALDDQRIAAIGMRQTLIPDTAQVLGAWEDGTAAVTMNLYGQGKAFAVGTLPGSSYMKTALRFSPWARGGRKTIYHPTNFDLAATRLVRLGIEAAGPVQEVVCSHPLVEAMLIDDEESTLVTLTNWTNEAARDLQVAVKMPFEARAAWQVEAQKTLPISYSEGIARFQLDLNEADFVLLSR